MKLCQLFCWRVIPVSTEREQTLELNACVRTVAPKEVDENQDTSAVSSNYWWQFFLVARLIKDKADASSTVNQSVMWVVCMELKFDPKCKWSVFRAKYLKSEIEFEDHYLITVLRPMKYVDRTCKLGCKKTYRACVTRRKTVNHSSPECISMS